jgi:hypothetical protein
VPKGEISNKQAELGVRSKVDEERGLRSKAMEKGGMHCEVDFSMSEACANVPYVLFRPCKSIYLLVLCCSTNCP